MIRYSCFHFNQVCHEVYGYRNDWQRTVSSEEMNKNYQLIRSNLWNTVDRYPIESLVEVVPRSRTVGNLHEIGKMGKSLRLKHTSRCFSPSQTHDPSVRQHQSDEPGFMHPNCLLSRFKQFVRYCPFSCKGWTSIDGPENSVCVCFLVHRGSLNGRLCVCPKFLFFLYWKVAYQRFAGSILLGPRIYCSKWLTGVCMLYTCRFPADH